MLIMFFFSFIVLALPLFFFWQWVAGKFVKTSSKKRWVAVAAVFISIPVLYFSVMAAWFWSLSFYPRREFNQSSWQKDLDKRYEMSEYIIDNKLLLGKSKEEINQLLGTASEAFEKDTWTYYIGFVPGFVSIDPDVLEIEFVNGIVVKVLQRET